MMDSISLVVVEPNINCNPAFNCNGGTPGQSTGIGEIIPSFGNYINCFTCQCTGPNSNSCLSIVSGNVAVNNTSPGYTTCVGKYLDGTGTNQLSFASTPSGHKAKTDDTPCPYSNFNPNISVQNWNNFAYGPGYKDKDGGCK
jgi:hypothetical protein